MAKYILTIMFLAFSTCTGDKTSTNAGDNEGGADGNVSATPGEGAEEQNPVNATDQQEVELDGQNGGAVFQSLFAAVDFKAVCLTGQPSCAEGAVPKCFAIKKAAEQVKTLNKINTDPDFGYFVKNSVVACVNAQDNSVNVGIIPKCSGGVSPVCGLKEIDVSSSYYQVFCDKERQATSLTVKCPYGGWAVCSKAGRTYCVNDDGYMLSDSGYRESKYSIRCEDPSSQGSSKKPVCLQAESSPFSSERIAPSPMK